MFNKMLDDLRSMKVSKKSIETCNFKELSKVYSEDEILELIELDRTIHFERTTDLFMMYWNHDIFPEPNQLLITDEKSWKRIQQLLNREDFNKIYKKPYNQEDLDMLKDTGQIQSWREVMAYDLFYKMKVIDEYLRGNEAYE